MRKIYFALFVLVCGVVDFHLIAQERLTYEFNKSDGLSGNSVTAIQQDDLGFIWIGTKNGLNRFDGKNFRIYNSENSSFHSSDINDLLYASNNVLYIATADGGLYVYDQSKELITEVSRISSSGSTTIQIVKIHNSSNGRILLGTTDGLYSYSDNGTNKVLGLSTDTEIADDPIQDIFEDPDGNIWLASYGGGLFRYFENKIEKIIPTGRMNPSHILALSYFENGNLLIGTQDDGLLIYDIKLNEVRHVSSLRNPIGGIIRDILFDGEHYWIATEGNGIVAIQRSDHELQILQEIGSDISNETATEIYIDNQNNIWIGTAWNGVSVLTDSNAPRKFNDFPVLSIFDEGRGTLIGTDGNGLWNLSENSKLYRYTNIVSEYVQYIGKRNNGQYWLGTYSNGLVSFNPKEKSLHQFRRIDNENSISFNDVRDVVELSNGDLYVATWGGGLNFYNSNEGVWSVPISKSYKINNIVDLLSYGNDYLYMATFGNGLIRYEMPTSTIDIIDYNEKPSTVSKFKNQLVLHQDHHEDIWIGTWEDGLLRFNPTEKSFVHYSGEVTLGRKTFVSILPDSKGDLWFGTKNGILKYSHENDKFQAFPELEGEFHIKSSFVNDNGDFHFGHTGGMISFNPLDIKEEMDSINVVFTDLLLFGETVSYEDGIIKASINTCKDIFLRHNQNIITIAFSGMDFPDNRDISYHIRMLNFEEKWRNIGNQNTSTYTNLESGTYTFQVRAMYNNEMVGNAMLNVTVKSAPWATWWAFLSYVVLACIILYISLRYYHAWVKMKNNLRYEQFKREKENEVFEVKQRFFTNISHEIRTPVTLILGALNQLIEKGITSKSQLKTKEVVQKNSHRLLHLVNELLDYRKLESAQEELKVTKVDLVDLIKEVHISFADRARELNINYQCLTTFEQIDVWIDISKMEKVIFNLLSNAFKYTGRNGSISVSLDKDDEFAYISVKDNGSGIDSKDLNKIFDRFYQSESSLSKPGFGIGLSIAKNIVELHSGLINVESEKDRGSNFGIKLKLGNDHFETHLIKNHETVSNASLAVQNLDSNGTNSSDLIKLEHASLLIVEDNQEIRTYLRSIFRNSFRILEAGNGKEGLDIASGEIPDLIISDVMMPVMDGIEFTKKIKTDMRTCHIPVIILTARTAMIYKKEGLETGADEYVTKPFNESLLITRVNNLLKNRLLLRKKFQTDKFIEPKELPISAQDEVFLKQIIQLLELNIEKGELKAEFFATELGMSHSVIYKKIKALTGQSLVEFVREFRIKRAANYITTHKYGVNEACYAVGFTDRKYFGQIFKKKYGLSPREYAKSLQED
ncbi:MAG: response regulator [Cytophagales bacterium]|nr:response regulator [Cytophagales bacterium]